MSETRPPSASKEEVGVSTPSTKPTQPPDRIPRNFGRYKIINRIGRGGMGAVYRAHDTQLDREVALKVPFLRANDVELRQRFYREARAAATVQHPNICPVFDVGELHNLPYLTMAFVEGRSLAQLLESGPPFTPTQIAQLIRKVALGMHEAHTKGVIHRDLKPANILLRPNGEPVVTDFGLARRDDDVESAGLTRQGEVIGTLEYMSPEQIDGDNSAVGPAADVYALGVVLFELLTGRRPFYGNTTTKMAAILLKPPPRPSDIRPGVPAQLEEICLKAMARNPGDRYGSMTHFATALLEYLRSPQPKSAPPVAPPMEQAGPTPTPTATQRIVKAKFAESDDRADETPTVIKPPSVVRTRPSGRRKKKPKPTSNPLLLYGGAALALVCITAIIVAIILKPGSSDGNRSAQMTEPTASPTPPDRPAPPPPTVQSAPTRPMTPNNTQPTRPSTTTKVEPQATPVLRIRPADLRLAVGEQREVTIELDRRGYRGPLKFRWDAPRELRVTSAKQLTLRPGDPDPVLSVRLLAEPVTGDARLTITGEATQEPRVEPLTTQLSVGVTPSSCVRVIETVNRPGAIVEAMALSPDASLALVGNTETKDANAIQVWDTSRGETVSPLVGHATKVAMLTVAGNGKSAISLGTDDIVILWDLARGRRELQSPRQTLRTLSMAVSPDGKWGLVAHPGVLMKVDLVKFRPSGVPIKTAALTGNAREDAIRTVAVGTKNRALAGGGEGRLFLLDLADQPQSRPKPLQGHREDVLCAAFSATGDLAVTGGGSTPRGVDSTGPENTVYLWDVNSGMMKWRAEGHNRPVVCVAISSDGQLVASGGSDGEVRVWSADSAKPVASFTGHSGRVLTLAFTGDGKSVWSGAADGTLRHWRLP